MTVKLDISKAYDRVEWAYLDKIMEKLDFHQRWRNLMMQCVSLVTYSVGINGKPRGHIVLTRRLHQGDPLSPYLFLLRAEGLSTLIKNFMSKGVVEGIFVCRRGLSISHLFFADDNIIFCKASIKECGALQCILKVNELASGQQLNRAKTSLFFSPNTKAEIKNEIQARVSA